MVSDISEKDRLLMSLTRNVQPEEVAGQSTESTDNTQSHGREPGNGKEDSPLLPFGKVQRV